MWKSNNEGFKEATFIHTGRRGRDPQRHQDGWRHGVAQRGAEAGTGGPTLMCGGLKTGGLLGEQEIPAPVQTTQPRVPAPGSLHNFWL